MPTFAEPGRPDINVSKLAEVIEIRVSVNKAAAAAPVQKRLTDLGLESVNPQSRGSE